MTTEAEIDLSGADPFVTTNSVKGLAGDATRHDNSLACEMPVETITRTFGLAKIDNAVLSSRRVYGPPTISDDNLARTSLPIAIDRLRLACTPSGYYALAPAGKIGDAT
jgi:hypothetical protein